ncbi:hypothetical protein QBC35DRAFT_444796 [Podospora australis]|uniref:Polyketide synthase n=1 Tax=Podospora australis TaxID=1536484 RepID=A0AAN7ABL8_9PEZI|nr:hypothetical protein QBC35DRAFT_444796 [Podospora australis]
MHHLFEQAAQQHPGKTALICGTTGISFGQLNTFTNCFAQFLIKHGIGKGDLVGVALDRSIDLVATLLAVLKTGAAYVPIDPAFPAERIGQMVEDACPKLIITEANIDTETLIHTAGTSFRSITLDEAKLHMINYSNTASINTNNLPQDIQDDDLAYVMYTSGSTGRPKGVEITRGSVANLLLSLKDDPGCNSTDRLLAVTTVSFDMAVVELFLPLICGATVIVAQKHQVKDPTALVGLMKRHQVTILQGTPALWQMLLDSGWQGDPRLPKILCGGEALSRALVERLLPTCGDMMWNMYGPTEATVYASICRVYPGQDVTIGGPVKNGHLYVVDPETLAPLTTGSVGELCIGGAGVARGYRNKQEVTRTKFVDDPFHRGSLMYRTGDLARFVAPEDVSLIGRMDNQVKVRGYRIELGDVEAAITQHESISAAVVVLRDDRLVAYCNHAPTEANNALAKQNRGLQPLLDHVLRTWLADRLPSYMLPAFFVKMDAFPLTLNGKVDRKALPDPVEPEPFYNPPGSLATASLTQFEEDILSVWSKVLGHNRINLTDNFFEIGGDSARIVRVQKELQALLGCSIPVPALFENFTISGLARFVAEHSSHATNKKIESIQPTEAADDDDVAIISMACRLPGDITTPEDFWGLLERGGDAIINAPKGRWDTHMPCDASCRLGGFLTQVTEFDTSLFGISPREASSLDPSQYVMLETCWEAFELAGYTIERLRGSQTGVFVGTSNILAHQGLNPTAAGELEDLDGYTVTGSAAAATSGRISYLFGLHGPAMTIDTACSSSLVTTHLACNALRQGECDLAISGGVSLMLNPGLQVEFSRLGGISADGRCHSFSDDADGTGFSEGSVVVLLKRLTDAQRDGDLIHAVIRGSAVNHDGRSATLTTPSGQAQQKLIHTALSNARLQPSDVDYIEAHGTGTRLGDPIEASALADVFGPSRAHSNPLFIGSSKSNVGHTQAAAGLAGLLKVVLSLQHNTLPKTMHITKPTSAIDWNIANMTPVMNAQPWRPYKTKPRRAGVSAFGIGGTNAHVIIEEAPRLEKRIDTQRPSSGPLRHLFLLSACTTQGLQLQVKKLHHHIRTRNEGIVPLQNVAYSLATTRNHFQRRVAIVAHNKDELLQKLSSNELVCGGVAMTPTRTPKLAMLFSGQGSQWPGMGMELAKIYPVFGDMLHRIVDVFCTQLDLPLLDVMWATPGTTEATLLSRTDYAQPALFALEVSLWHLWKSWGVTPSYLLGHSLGELAAAHVAGILSLTDACRLVAARGRLMQAQSGNYEMISLEAGAEETAETIDRLGLGTAVDIALYNTPTQTVVSGDTSAVRAIAAHFAGQNRKTSAVVSGHAFHSRYMEGMLEGFLNIAENIQFHSPTLSIISSLDGRLGSEMAKPEYWGKQVRQPVRFNEGIQALVEQHEVDIFLEVGPNRVLCGMGVACLPLGSDQKCWVPSLVPNEEPGATLQSSLSSLYLRNVPINWGEYYEPLGCHRVELPTYAFHRTFVQKSEPRHAVSKRQRSIDSSTDRISLASTGDSTSRSTSPPRTRQNFQFGIQWQPVEITNLKFSPSRPWGLLAQYNHSTWTTAIITAMAQAGVELVHVEDLTLAQNTSFEGLVCLWDSDDAGEMSHLQEPEVIGKALEQLQTAAKMRLIPQLVWITRHAVGTGIISNDRDMVSGAGPLLWGLMRTARSEHPELRLRLVDAGSDMDFLPAALILKEPECAVRTGGVLMPRIRHVDPVPELETPMAPIIRSDGAVLVTGGLGHIGARVARWLVTTHHVRDLILTSRLGMETPGAATLVDELSSFNVKVTVIAGDIGNPETVRSIMSTFNQDRPLRGVIHAAGVSDSGILSTMTPERCQTTIVPKAYGAWLLHEAIKNMDLDLFVMFSSISGVMGLPGLANYAAANTFLDALAHMRRANGLPATSVAYGTWEGDGGMASRLGSATKSHLQNMGLNPLQPDDGLDILYQAIVSRRALTVAAELNLKHLQAHFQEQAGGVPPLFASILNQASATAQAPSLVQRLREAEPENHTGITLSMVREVVAKALGFTDPFDVEVERPLKDVGIDSLTAVQIRNHLATLTGLTLSVNVALHHPTLSSLSLFVLGQLQAEHNKQLISPTKPSEGDLSLNMGELMKGCLDKDFTFNRDHVVERPNAALLTGATGFVGAFILYELLKQGIKVYCLVRAASSDKAQDRIKTALEEYGLLEVSFGPLIKPVIGDIGKPLLGLTKETFTVLADEVDTICHSGALVDWMRRLDDYVGPNIVSTHELLRLASLGRPKAIHLVSTISTLPKHMGLDLTEEDIEYGYGTSKYLAERIVSAARWRGAKAAVYRLPYVTASTTTGHFRKDQGDFLHNLIVGCLQMGAFPLVEGADMSAVLPVDYLAKTIVSVMADDRARLGRDYDFLNMRAPTSTSFFKMIGAAVGLDGGKKKEATLLLPFGTWKKRALEYAVGHPKSGLARISAVLDTYTEENAVTMFKGVSQVGENVFGGLDAYPAPLVDEGYVRTYLDRIRSYKREV